MYTDITGYAPEWIKLAVGTIAIIALAAVTVGAILVSGGTLLIPALIGAGIGAGTSFLSQGIGNFLSGKKFFDDFNIESVLVASLAGAAFATGFGGFWGAIGIGSLSNGGLAAIQQQSWESIGVSIVIGGFAAGVGYTMAEPVPNGDLKTGV